MTLVIDGNLIAGLLLGIPLGALLLTVVAWRTKPRRP